MNEPFSEKLTLVLKVLSMSRARLASELGIDKSVVARWVSGATVPSSHNLAQLSAMLSHTIPGFTALDWDRDIKSLAGLLGVNQTPPGVAESAPAKRVLEMPFLDQIAATTSLRAKAYEGFYRSTRPYTAHPGRFIHDHVMVRTGPDGLMRFKMNTGGVPVEGWVLPMQNQLYIVGAEFTGGSLVFGIVHGVNTVKADLLDGITLTATHDTGRTLAATPVVYERVGELTGDEAADDAYLAELGAANPVAPEGSLPESLVRHLTRDIHPPPGGAPEWGVRLPLTQALSRGPPPDFL